MSNDIQPNWTPCPVDAESRLSPVSAVIPARNEEQSLGAVLERALRICSEVIVVDGQSTDRTRQVAESFGVKVLGDTGLGKGEALRLGAAAASLPVLVFLDADGSHDPGDIPRLAAPIIAGDADLVIGSRARGGSDELHGSIGQLIRYAGSDLLLIGINYRFKADLSDCQNGFRAIRAEVFSQIACTENTFTIEQEMVMKTFKAKLSVTEVPAHEYARLAGHSKIKLHRVWWRFGYCFLKNL